MRSLRSFHLMKGSCSMRSLAVLAALWASAACAYEGPLAPPSPHTPAGIPTSLSLSTDVQRVPDLGGHVTVSLAVTVEEGTSLERVPISVAMRMDGIGVETLNVFYTDGSGRASTRFFFVQAGSITAKTGTLEKTVRIERGVAPAPNPTPSPTPPSPTPPAPPAPVPTTTLTGTVSEPGVGVVAGMNIEIRDGPDARRETQTNAQGAYQFSGLRVGTITVRAWKPGYNDLDRQVTLTSAPARLDFEVGRSTTPTPSPNPPSPAPTPPPPIFTRSGIGADVFDLPSGVSRVRIEGTYSGFCENFIIHIGGSSIVNEILGTCSSASGTSFSGTFLTPTGRTVEIKNATGISWTFTEVR